MKTTNKSTLENPAPVLFGRLVLPDGSAGVTLPGGRVEVMDFISNQYRHGKTILALGVSKALLDRLGVGVTMKNGSPDPGILTGESALGKHRHPQRELGVEGH